MLLVLYSIMMVSLVLESSIQLMIMFQESLKELMLQIQFTQMLLIDLHRQQDFRVLTGHGAAGRMEPGLIVLYLALQIQHHILLWLLPPITHLT